MTRLNKLLLGLAGALLLLLAARGCNAPAPSVAEQTTARSVALLVPVGNVAAVVVRGGVVSVARKDSKGGVTFTSRYVPPEGEVDVVVSTATGAPVTTVTVKDKGFCFSSGLYITEEIGVKASPWTYGLGAKVGFAGRFGLDVGLSGPQWAVFGAVSYTPEWRFQNTSLWLGYNTRQTIAGGLLVRF